MARISKKKKLERYKSRLDHARKWREDEGYDATWERMRDLYRGKHFPKSITDEDRISVNIAFSMVNVIVPSISINHPKIEVLPNKPDQEDQAVIAEAVVNYWWRHYDFRTPFRSAAKDFIIFGHAWIKVGYQFTEKEEKLGFEEEDEAFAEMRDEADAFAMQNPDMAADLPTDQEIAENLPETSTVVTEDRPTLERVSPFDMYVDPEATCMADAKWIAQRIIRPHEDVKKDKRYASGARSSVKPDVAVRADWLSEKEREKRDPDAERVTVWEYYDLQANTVATFAEGGDDYLIEPMKMPYTFGHPFEFMSNYDVPDEFYPIGDLEMIEDPQQELNKTRSQMMNHRKKYARKYLARVEAISPEGRDALVSNDDNAVIDVINENIPLQDVIAAVPITPLAAETYQYSEITEQDMDKISGVNEYARGTMPEVRRTATEAAMIQDAANARASDKLALIETAVSRIARKVLQLAQQFMSTEQVARVTGPDGQNFWVPFNWDDVKGEFDFVVEGGSTQPQNETFRRQQALALMNAMGPMIGTVIDPVEIAKHVLQQGFGVKNPAKFMIQQMPPGMDPNADPNAPQDPNAPPPGMDPAMMSGGGAGMDAPQMDPRDLEALKVQAQDQQASNPIPQIPPEILAQLQGQMGLGV